MPNLSTTNELKILTFGLYGDIYGIDILLIKQVLRMKETKIWEYTHPTIPSLKNFFQFQNEIIPLLDLRLKLNLPYKKFTNETPILFIDHGLVSVGFAVDYVFSVGTYFREQLQSLHPFYYADKIAPFDKAYLQDDNIVCMLDINNIFTQTEINKLTELSTEAIKLVNLDTK